MPKVLQTDVKGLYQQTGTGVNLAGKCELATTAQMSAGDGMSGAELINYSVVTVGNIIYTTILIDLTGLESGDAGDIIGTAGESSCHIGQITAAVNGTIFAGRVTNVETIAGGDPDIDLYYATESTGAQDAGIGSLTETQVTNGGDHVHADTDYFMTGINPAANSYLYLVDQGGTAVEYSAGRLLIEMWGT